MKSTDFKRHALRVAQYLIDQDNERAEYVEWCDLNQKDLQDATNGHPFMSALLLLETVKGVKS